MLSLFPLKENAWQVGNIPFVTNALQGRSESLLSFSAVPITSGLIHDG
jgi:hypothetical protein